MVGGGAALAGPAPLGVGTFSGFSLPPPPPPLGSNLTFLTFSPLALADEAAALAAAADSGFPEVRGVCLGAARGVGLVLPLLELPSFAVSFGGGGFLGGIATEPKVQHHPRSAKRSKELWLFREPILELFWTFSMAKKLRFDVSSLRRD